MTIALTACATAQNAHSVAQSAPAQSASAQNASAQTAAARTPAFAFRADLPLGKPNISLLLNREGSPRVENPALYDTYRRDFGDDVARWAREPGIYINPNYVFALFAKESGFDPRATSNVPANGVAQMTPIADADLLRITRDDPRWHWLQQEALSWPRHPLVHDTLAKKARTDSLLRARAIDARTEYFFNPGTESRAAMIWLRMLADTWRGDTPDQEAADVAKTKLNGGKPLTDEQIFELVTVSYNQGYPYVVDLLRKHGRDWKKHLNEESSDYLDRIRIYTVIFQNAR